MPVVLTVASALLLAMCVVAPLKNERLSHDVGLGIVAAGALFFLGTTLAGLWFLSEASALYRETDEGLTKQNWFGSVHLPWNRLVGLQIRVASRPVYILRASTGRKAAVRFDLLGDAGDRLLTALRERLPALVDHYFSELAANGRVYRPGYKAGVLIFIFVSLPCFLISSLGFVLRAPDSPSGVGFSVGIIFGLCGAVALALSLHEVFRTLHVTGSVVEERSLFTRRSIPLSAIESIHIRHDDDKVILKGEGQRIHFSSRVDDYSLILKLLRERAEGAELIER